MIGCHKGLYPYIPLGTGMLRRVVPFLVYSRKRIIRRETPSVRAGLSTLCKRRSTQAQGRAYLTLTARSDMMRRLFVSPLPLPNPGWEYHRFPFPRNTPEESDGARTPLETGLLLTFLGGLFPLILPLFHPSGYASFINFMTLLTETRPRSRGGPDY